MMRGAAKSISPQMGVVSFFGVDGQLLQRREVCFDAKSQQDEWDREAEELAAEIIREDFSDLHPFFGGLLLVGLFAVATLCIVAAGI